MQNQSQFSQAALRVVRNLIEAGQGEAVLSALIDLPGLEQQLDTMASTIEAVRAELIAPERLAKHNAVLKALRQVADDPFAAREIAVGVLAELTAMWASQCATEEECDVQTGLEIATQVTAHQVTDLSVAFGDQYTQKGMWLV